MNALIAPQKTLPWPGGGCLHKLCRAGKKKKKKLGGGMFADPIRFNGEKTKYILITTASNVSGSGPREAGHLNAPCPDHQV